MTPINEAPARDCDAGTEAGCSLLEGENTQGHGKHYSAKQALRDVRTAAVKLSHFGAWLHGAPADFTPAPILLGDISEQLWRAASTLAAELRGRP
jgi:hypothetical protein